MTTPSDAEAPTPTPPSSPQPGADFDPDALRKKYREERDRRLRADGNDQYVEVEGAFRHFVDDPYVEPGFTRAPLEDEVEVAVIGAGFGGLLAGAHLREVGTDYTRRCGYDRVGRDGVSLSERWADGARTLHGLYGRGFPNCFLLNPIQAGFTANFPHLLSEQSRHIAYVVGHAREQGFRTVEVSQEAEDAWVETIANLARLNLSFFEECTPGYYNNEGRPGERSGQNGFYGAGSPKYFELLAEWRDKGDLAGLEPR